MSEKDTSYSGSDAGSPIHTSDNKLAPYLTVAPYELRGKEGSDRFVLIQTTHDKVIDMFTALPDSLPAVHVTGILDIPISINDFGLVFEGYVGGIRHIPADTAIPEDRVQIIVFDQQAQGVQLEEKVWATWEDRAEDELIWDSEPAGTLSDNIQQRLAGLQVLMNDR